MNKNYINRREFIRKSISYSSILFFTAFFPLKSLFSSDTSLISKSHEASFYSVLSPFIVQCQLCFRRCVINKRKRGFCKARENKNGKLYSLTYNRPVAIHIDPVEKIPFSHFYPGTDVLCIGTAGCNLMCLNCINWHFALKAPEDVDTLSYYPEDVIKMVKDNNLTTICFTYNEPTMCYEYMRDVFKLAQKQSIKTVFHSNASMNVEPLIALLPYVDAVIADLKAFNKDFYIKNCSSILDPVLSFLKIVKKNNIWLEIVNLVIPGLNDNEEDIKKMCTWIKDNIGAETPLQFSRFFPTYKLTNLPPTPVKILKRAYQIALDTGIKYVYIGNVPGIDQINTYCPDCKKLLIERKGLSVRKFNIENGRCKFCKKIIEGRWRGA